MPIPDDPATADLAAQLEADGVALGPGVGRTVADPAFQAGLRSDLEAALKDVGAPAGGGSAGQTDSTGAVDPEETAGIVVLEDTPDHVPALRDLAQDLQSETGLDTVIVRSPGVAIATSDELSRAQIERGQRAMVAEPDYAQGVRDFFGEAEGFSVPWGLVAACFVVAIAGVVVAVVAAVMARDGAEGLSGGEQAPRPDKPARLAHHRQQ